MKRWLTCWFSTLSLKMACWLGTFTFSSIFQKEHQLFCVGWIFSETFLCVGSSFSLGWLFAYWFYLLFSDDSLYVGSSFSHGWFFCFAHGIEAYKLLIFSQKKIWVYILHPFPLAFEILSKIFWWYFQEQRNVGIYFTRLLS